MIPFLLIELSAISPSRSSKSIPLKVFYLFPSPSIGSVARNLEVMPSTFSKCSDRFLTKPNNQALNTGKG
jgi:hypothetical protein